MSLDVLFAVNATVIVNMTLGVSIGPALLVWTSRLWVHKRGGGQVSLVLCHVVCFNASMLATADHTRELPQVPCSDLDSHLP